MTQPPAASERLQAAATGRARNGTVSLRDFDEGVVETLGAVPKATPNGEYYFLCIEGISPPPGWPGVPVVFSNPEDIFAQYRLPMILVRRDDISPAMQRWHPSSQQYRVPVKGAHPVKFNWGGHVYSGYDRYEQRQQAAPFDLMYTLQVAARYRGAPGNRGIANLVLEHVLRVYPPYCRVVVKDSDRMVRTYEAFMEGIAPLDEAADVADRMIGFGVTLRVEAELDLHDPMVSPAVTAPTVVRTRTR